ncbi:MAG: ABC transporter ATP-binding protein [Planctomycetaceae bacterium]
MGSLEFAGLHVRYGARAALAEVSGAIRPGDRVGLLGPNGSGKTTLLRALCGIVRPERGSVLLDGKEIGTLPRRAIARDIAYLPQEERWEFPFTVEEVVRCGRFPHAGPLAREGAGDHAAIEEALRAVDLLAMRERPITELSGGERRRAALARSLAQEAPFLLLDEPTSALDLEHRQAILRVLKRAPGAVLLSTHDLDLAAEQCNRILVLDAGRVAAQGAPGEVLNEALLERVFRVRARVHRFEGRIHVVAES